MALLLFRNNLDAFNGEFSHEVRDSRVFVARWVNGSYSATLEFEPAAGA